MQDILGGVVVAVQFSSTVRAGVPSHTEVFFDDAPTSATGLTGSVGCYLHDGATSLFRFVACHRDEGSPACIEDTLIQSTFSRGAIRKRDAMLILFWLRTLRHVLDVQVLKDQGCVGLDEGTRFFMEKVAATVADFAVQARQFFLGASSAMTALLAAVDFAMSCLDLLFGVPIEAWTFNALSIGEHSKGLHAQINANGFLRRRKGHRWVKLILRAEESIPLFSFSLHGTGLDLAYDLPMQLDLDVTNLGKAQSFPDELVAALGIGETHIAIRVLEPWIAWRLPILDTTEEGGKGFVEPFEHILLHLAMNSLVFFPEPFDLRQLVGLHSIGNGYPTQPIGLSAFLQGRIVQLFAPAQRPFERSDLLLRRIDAELVSFTVHIRVLGLLRVCGLSIPGHGLRYSF